MTAIPDLIRIVREGDKFSFTIDGQEFPFYLADEPITVRMERASIGHVTFTVLAERVEVIDSYSATPTPGEEQ